MYISTAVIAGDYLYTLNNVGRAVLLRMEDGQGTVEDASRRAGRSGEAWGSLVYGDGRVYITDRRGARSSSPPGRNTSSSPSTSSTSTPTRRLRSRSGDIYIRTHKHLWCIGKTEKKDQ